jgi:MFS family permease
MPDDGYFEETEEALLEGDTRYTPGTARSALARPTFRRIYTGFFLSNIGTWMQQVALGVLGYELTESAVFVGVLLFAQLGPTLFVGPVAGVIADSVDRRKLLLVVCGVQMTSAFALAAIVSADDPSEVAITVAVLLGGIALATFMPTFSAILPQIVGRADLPGAISLQSAQMNISRVIGPMIGAVALPAFGYSGVFIANGISYLFLVVALVPVHLPATKPDDGSADERGYRRLTSGVRIARRNRIVGRSLVIVAAFSSLCLLWVGQFPVFAAQELGIDGESTAYQVLFACFGLGAAIGSLSMGTVLSRVSKPKLVRHGLVAYAFVLAVYAMLRSPAPAFPVVTVLGACYFGTITALNTTMQAELANHERGRVMALWMMGFGGAVAIANLVFAPLVDAVGMPPLMLTGAVIALALSRYADLRPPDDPDATAPSAAPRRLTYPSSNAAASRSRPATRLPFTRTASPSPTAPIVARAPSRPEQVGSP